MNSINNPRSENDIFEHRFGRETDGKLTKHKKMMAWRRQNTLTLLTQGYNTYEIAQIMHTSLSTSSRDIEFLRNRAADELKKHIQSLPHEYQLAYRGLSECLKYAWRTLLSQEDYRNKVAILSLIASIYKQRIEMATNAGVIQESLSYVEQAKKTIMQELNNKKEGG